jgi:hypothetical protein
MSGLPIVIPDEPRSSLPRELVGFHDLHCVIGTALCCTMEKSDTPLFRYIPQSMMGI